MQRLLREIDSYRLYPIFLMARGDQNCSCGSHEKGIFANFKGVLSFRLNTMGANITILSLLSYTNIIFHA